MSDNRVQLAYLLTPGEHRYMTIAIPALKEYEAATMIRRGVFSELLEIYHHHETQVIEAVGSWLNRNLPITDLGTVTIGQIMYEINAAALAIGKVESMQKTRSEAINARMAINRAAEILRKNAAYLP